MATASAFGFSGWDPLGSFAESTMNAYFTKEMADYNAKLQYDYAKKYALHTPSWNKQGLESAGLNPIAYLANGNAAAATTPSINSSTNPSNASGGFDATAFQAAKNAKKDKELEQDAIRAQAEKARAEGEAADKTATANSKNADANQWQIYDAQSSGHSGFKASVIGVGGNGEVFSKTIQTYRVNKVTGKAYTVPGNQEIIKIDPISAAPKDPPVKEKEVPTHTEKYFYYKETNPYQRHNIDFNKVKNADIHW